MDELAKKITELKESEEPILYIGEEFLELAPEIIKLANLQAEARSILQEWVDKQGHERCWYYPELFKKLAALYGVKPTVDPALPPEEEFEKGCQQYRREEYSKQS